MTGEITQDALKELLDYDPETGEFRWRRRVSTHVYAGDVAGGPRPDGYRALGISGTQYFAHRLAWLYVHGKWPDGQIDHINGIKDDNRIVNLRVAKSPVEQQQNQALHRDNTSGFPGVRFHKRDQKYSAQIRFRGKQHHLGTFDCLEDAGKAYKEAKQRLHKFCPEVRDFTYPKEVTA